MSNKITRILSVTNSTFTLSAGMLGPVYVAFGNHIDQNFLDIAWAYAVFMITTGLLIRFFAKLENRIGHRKTILFLGYAVMCLGYLSYLYVDNSWQLLGSQLLLGVAQAATIPVFYTMFSDSLQQHNEVKQWGSLQSGSFITTGVFAAVSSVIVQYVSYQVVLWAMFGFSVLGLLNTARLFWVRDYTRPPANITDDAETIEK